MKIKSPNFGRTTYWVYLAFCVGLSSVLFLQSKVMGESASTTDSASKLDRLVNQLGSDEFIIRERAKEELLLQGIEAFDVLFVALRHSDLEIRIQAKSLIRSIPMHWTNPTDSDAIRNILDTYNKQSREQRAASIRRLQDVGDDEAARKLCQIVRFEMSEYLSKLAAIRIIESTIGDVKDQRRDRAKLIADELKLSRRNGANWLRTYNRYLLNPKAVASEWPDHLTDQLEAARFSTDSYQRTLVRDFARWQIKMYAQIEQPQQIASILENVAPSFTTSQAELLDLIDWLTKNNVSDDMFVIEKQFEHLIDSDPLLHFTLIQFYDKLNQQEHKEALTKRAFQLIDESTADEKIDLAENLVSRGWIDWAEQALAKLVKDGDPSSDETARARVLLALTFFDWGNFKKCSDYLKPIAKLIETDRIFERTVATVSNHTSKSLRCHYYFSLGLFHREEGNTTDEIKNLELAWAADRTNVDALIALFRTNTDDQKWKDGILTQLKAKITQYDSDIKSAKQLYENRQSAMEISNLALNYNQYAWLVSNTIGDRELARERSEKSLKLIPNSASYLDTLARCHYSLGDYENAVATQKKAAKLQPESGQILRQLEIFEKALAGRPKKQSSPE